jgi:hypothetical protein
MRGIEIIFLHCFFWSLNPYPYIVGRGVSIYIYSNTKGSRGLLITTRPDQPAVHPHADHHARLRAPPGSRAGTRSRAASTSRSRTPPYAAFFLQFLIQNFTRRKICMTWTHIRMTEGSYDPHSGFLWSGLQVSMTCNDMFPNVFVIVLFLIL